MADKETEHREVTCAKSHRLEEIAVQSGLKPRPWDSRAQTGDNPVSLQRKVRLREVRCRMPQSTCTSCTWISLAKDSSFSCSPGHLCSPLTPPGSIARCPQRRPPVGRMSTRPRKSEFSLVSAVCSSGDLERIALRICQSRCGFAPPTREAFVDRMRGGAWPR